MPSPLFRKMTSPWLGGFWSPFSVWTWQSSAVTKSQHALEHRPPIQPFFTTNGTSTTLPRCCFHGVPTSLRDGITDSTQCYRVHTPLSANSWIVWRQSRIWHTSNWQRDSAENVLSQELLSRLSTTREYGLLLTHTTSMTCLITLKLLDLWFSFKFCVMNH